MFFTQDDYKKIEDWLRTRTIKDTDFPIADAIKENDLITIVQDGENKTVQFSSLVLDVLNRYCPNVYNIHRRESITIEEAVSLVPEECRKPGLIITFYSANDSDYYEIWQFVGSTPMDVLNHWGEYDDEHYWINRYKDVYRTISAIYSRIDGIENHVTNIGKGLTEHENNTNQEFGRIRASMQSLNNSIMNTDSKIETLGNSKGNPNGIAPLDGNGLIPSAHLPSYVDDVLEYESRAGFPSVGEGGKLYVERSGGKVYRWAGTQYIEITNDLHLGEGSWEAFPGDRGVALEEESEDLQEQINHNKTLIADVFHDFKEMEVSKGQPDGIATLDVQGQIPKEYLKYANDIIYVNEFVQGLDREDIEEGIGEADFYDQVIYSHSFNTFLLRKMIPADNGQTIPTYYARWTNPTANERLSMEYYGDTDNIDEVSPKALHLYVTNTYRDLYFCDINGDMFHIIHVPDVEKISDIDNKVNSLETTVEENSNKITEIEDSKGQPNGIATLDNNETIPLKNLRGIRLPIFHGFLDGTVNTTYGNSVPNSDDRVLWYFTGNKFVLEHKDIFNNNEITYQERWKGSYSILSSDEFNYESGAIKMFMCYVKDYYDKYYKYSCRIFYRAFQFGGLKKLANVTDNFYGDKISSEYLTNIFVPFSEIVTDPIEEVLNESKYSDIVNHVIYSTHLNCFLYREYTSDGVAQYYWDFIYKEEYGSLDRDTLKYTKPIRNNLYYCLNGPLDTDKGFYYGKDPDSLMSGEVTLSKIDIPVSSDSVHNQLQDINTRLQEVSDLALINNEKISDNNTAIATNYQEIKGLTNTIRNVRDRIIIIFDTLQFVENASIEHDITPPESTIPSQCSIVYDRMQGWFLCKVGDLYYRYWDNCPTMPHPNNVGELIEGDNIIPYVGTLYTTKRGGLYIGNGTNGLVTIVEPVE